MRSRRVWSSKTWEHASLVLLDHDTSTTGSNFDAPVCACDLCELIRTRYCRAAGIRRPTLSRVEPPESGA